MSPLLILFGARGLDALPRKWNSRAFGSTAIQLYLLVSVAPVALVLDLHQCIRKIEAGFVTVLFLCRLSEHDDKGSSLYVLGSSEVFISL